MKYVVIVLGWIFGLLALLGGVILLFSAPVPTIPLIIIALLLLPPVNNYVHSKTGRRLPAKPKAVMIIALFVIFGFLAAQDQQRGERNRRAQLEQQTKEKIARAQQEATAFFTLHRDSILNAVEAALDSSHYNSAIELTEQYRVANDPALIALNATAINKAREDSILTALKKLPSDGYVEKSEALYRELVALDPSNKTYSDKYQYFSNKASEIRRLKREGEKRAHAEADRKAQIENQFSAWNGAHRNLERAIKESMNDPDSFKHVKTVYWDRGDYLVVKTTFRGKNAFGGVVKNSVTAKVSLDGQILEILAQEP